MNNKLFGCLLISVAVMFSTQQFCLAEEFNIGDNITCLPFGSQWVSGKVIGKVMGGYTVSADGHVYTIPDTEHSGSPRIKRGAPAADAGGGQSPQNQLADVGQNFNTGDSVMVRPFGSQWMSGRVISKVLGGYQVNVDGHDYIIPDNEHSGSPRIKPGNNGGNGGLPPANQTPQDQLPPANQAQGQNPANGALPPDRPCIDCSAGGPSGKNGDPPPSMNVLKRLLQCIWERPASPGSDGAITVDVRSLKMTGQRLNGNGQRNTDRSFTDPLTPDPNRVIYMFDASYVRKTLYKYGTGVDDVSHEVFEAYVGMDNKWHMQSASGPNEHKTYYIHKD